MPYQQLLQQHSRVPHTGLLQLLQQSLQRVQNSGYAGAEVRPFEQMLRRVQKSGLTQQIFKFYSSWQLSKVFKE